MMCVEAEAGLHAAPSLRAKTLHPAEHAHTCDETLLLAACIAAAMFIITQTRQSRL